MPAQFARICIDAPSEAFAHAPSHHLVQSPSIGFEGVGLQANSGGQIGEPGRRASARFFGPAGFVGLKQGLPLVHSQTVQHHGRRDARVGQARGLCQGHAQRQAATQHHGFGARHIAHIARRCHVAPLQLNLISLSRAGTLSADAHRERHAGGCGFAQGGGQLQCQTLQRALHGQLGLAISPPQLCGVRGAAADKLRPLTEGG